MLIRSQNVHDDGLRLDDAAYIDDETDYEMRASRVFEADVLLNITGASLGRSALVGKIGRANVNQHVCILRVAKAEILPAFLQYAITSTPVQYSIFAGENGISREGLNFRQVGNLEIPVPALEAQGGIAAFLDGETARIDRLIAEKSRLIELLAEKRAAAITHAVTKGIDRKIRTKPSGIGWLGDVPAHWTHHKLGYLASMRGGCTPSKAESAYWEGDIPWVSPKDMKREVISDSEDHVTASALAETGLELFRPPVVLMVVRGMILAHSFPVAITAAPVTVNQDMKSLRPKPLLSADYLCLVLMGIKDAIRALVEESGHGTRVLRTELWKQFDIFLPPREEQAEILRKVRAESKVISDLVESARTAIDRLREYRAALITAAVTGRIDIRNHASNADKMVKEAVS
jgi:type I restriction enzyme, S subunit